MMRVALSGGIASGKTTVSDALAEFGVPVIDADILAREVVAPDSAGLAQVVEHFGESILDDKGALDRKQLRDIIFADETQRKNLEAILHPLIRNLTNDHLAQHEAAGALYCVVVIPLLIETNQQNNYDHVVIVDVEPAVQVKRVMQRDNCSKEHAEDIIASQASRKARLAAADDLILNSSTKMAMDLQVKKLHERLSWLAKRKQQNTDS